MHTNSPHVLVVGGAGFVGSHMVLALKAAGYKPIVLDNLSHGSRAAIFDTPLIVGEIADQALLSGLFSTYTFSAVMHFASFIDVAESVKSPQKYYENNVAATLNLLAAMLKSNSKHFIFSSSAAVYGNPLYTPIDEAHPLAPINPYGRSKRMIEEIIKDYAQSEGLHYAILRYFNAAGADPFANIGECHEPESHLIPLALQVAVGKRENIFVYGNDYPTVDGTCVRDYVHVTDICQAHLLALNALLANEKNIICNLGTGVGYSVQQVIEMVRQITQYPIPIVQTQRRLGDPAILVANATLAAQQLNWQPKYSDLETIIQHAWQFAQKTVTQNSVAVE